MAKTIFEEMGGTYTQVGDYLLPDLKLPEEEKQANIGVWGMRHKRFLKENDRPSGIRFCQDLRWRRRERNNAADKAGAGTALGENGAKLN